MFVVYVLQSASTGRLYIGQTADLERRLQEHASGQTPSTRGRGPWVLIGQRRFRTRREAMRFEGHLKALKRPERVRAALLEL